MKRPTEQLLDDLLEESAPPDFRAALMQETLRHARRRKFVRRLNLAAGVAALVGVIAVALWKPSPVVVAPNQLHLPPPGLTIVHSQPLRPEQIVRTQPDSLTIIASSGGGYTLIETRQGERFYTEIDDQQLFALLAGKPAALVHQEADRTELIFLNPEDQKELLVP